MGFLFPGKIVDYYPYVERVERRKQPIKREANPSFLYGKLPEKMKSVIGRNIVDGYTGKEFNRTYKKRRFNNDPPTTQESNTSYKRRRSRGKALQKQPVKHLWDLPSEILFKIIVLSSNLESLSQTNRFFHSFITRQKTDLEHATIYQKYVKSIPLEPSLSVLLKLQQIADLSDTEQHLENALHTTLDETIRHRQRRENSITQQHDKLIILNSKALYTKLLKPSMFRKFHIDLILCSKEIQKARDAIRVDMKKLEKQNDPSKEIKLRLSKASYVRRYPKIPFAMPFYNESNPEDIDYLIPKKYRLKLDIVKKLIKLNCLFSGDIEELLLFLINLNNAAIEEKDVPLDDNKDFYITVEEINKMLGDQYTPKNAHHEIVRQVDLTITNSTLVLTLLNRGKKKWIKYFLSKLDIESFRNDTDFWIQIVEKRDWKQVEQLKKYADLEPSSAVLSKVSKIVNSQNSQL